MIRTGRGGQAGRKENNTATGYTQCQFNFVSWQKRRRLTRGKNSSRSLRHKQRSLHVDFKLRVKESFIHLRQRLAPHNSRIQHKDIDPPESLHRFIKEVLTALEGRGVSAYGD